MCAYDQYKIIEIFYVLFLLYVFKILCGFYIYSASQVHVATPQVLKSRLPPVATVTDRQPWCDRSGQLTSKSTVAATPPAPGPVSHWLTAKASEQHAPLGPCAPSEPTRSRAHSIT